eukprot:353437-Chlamydomonas_euryale.AAC.3
MQLQQQQGPAVRGGCGFYSTRLMGQAFQRLDFVARDRCSDWRLCGLGVLRASQRRGPDSRLDPNSAWQAEQAEPQAQKKA